MTSVVDDFHPKEWKVFGSMDNISWFDIDHQKDDICKDHIHMRETEPKVYCCSKRVTKNYEVDTTPLMRYLKVQQIGQNSGPYYNPDVYNPAYVAFYLSRIQIFGNIMVPIQKCKCTFSGNRKTNYFLFITIYFFKL